ncbi:membrane protein [Mycobacterium avium 05-4293]|nr:membrane protein [Mycobacterium avium 05-4293]KDP09712.1 membrane protein [Mycobacterium avium subsp. hominissuis 100]
MYPRGRPRREPRKRLRGKGLMHMNTVFVGITLFTAAITAAIAVADFVPARFVLANSAEVGVPRSWLPALGAAKLAGAAGLVVGLLGLPALGIAAAAGLVVFFVGAVLTHLRAGVLYNIAFPGAYLCLSAASLAWMALR